MNKYNDATISQLAASTVFTLWYPSTQAPILDSNLPLPLPPKRKKRKRDPVEVTPIPKRPIWYDQAALQSMAIDLTNEQGQRSKGEADTPLTKLYHMDKGSISLCPLVHCAAPPQPPTLTKKVASLAPPRRPPTMLKQKGKSRCKNSIISSDFEPVPKSAMNVMKDDELSRFVSGLNWKSLYQTDSQPCD